MDKVVSGLVRTTGWLDLTVKIGGSIQRITPDCRVTSLLLLTVDARGALWVGSGGGLARFEGEIWTVYTTDNSGLPDDKIDVLASDAQGNVWIWAHGRLAQFDGEDWTVYTTSNSGLLSGMIQALAVDSQDHIWIGTGFWGESTSGGLTRFDGEHWTDYNHAYGSCTCFGCAGKRVGWTAPYCDALRCYEETSGGLAQFDGEDWTIYRTNNSSLASNWVQALASDAQGNLWVGTRAGLALTASTGQPILSMTLHCQITWLRRLL